MPRAPQGLRSSAALTINETPPAFDITLRGYERHQVDEHLAALMSDCLAADSRVRDLQARADDYQQRVSAPPSFAAAGSRVEMILRLAEEEAREVRAEAENAATQHRVQAAAAVAQILAHGEGEADNRKQQSERKCRQVIDAARAEAERLNATAVAEAADTMASAEQVIDEARAEARRIATEVTSRIHQRREQTERDMANRQEVAEQRLAETGQKAAQIREEAQQLRDDAEARAKVLLEATRYDAEQLVNDAREKAESARLDAERELAALTLRRDSINAQLSSVREMLAGLTGSAAALADRMGAAPPGPARAAGISAAAG